jgi:hypothetical protein
LKWAIPLTIGVIILLLYAATRSWFRVSVVPLAVPFSLVGAVWLLWLLGYHLSLAVWVGVIALAGLDAETGLVMLPYLDNSFERFQREDRSPTTLPAEPTPDDLVRYASLASPELEQKYWEWKSAIEQIPQDGTQATNLVLFAGVPVHTIGGAWRA